MPQKVNYTRNHGWGFGLWHLSPAPGVGWDGSWPPPLHPGGDRGHGPRAGALEASALPGICPGGGEGGVLLRNTGEIHRKTDGRAHQACRNEIDV